ncbi:type VI secretion system baseplate subunit TssE [Azospirillum picis]|uniref:Type VI secretion system protein ImpF n=1 Tax=Azospirillum picis TaxID=488438 RepID=A0ABU0MFM4_9PROT|nr:type VI secretion system baseplate subunit TssE [Azospirillum picis]MBP2298729.1 type VI secretion system protein ImpF [Azospirillum picis]MDQ0532222.1 type VI secretion system protein ImpF [Azospirillum picis]
MDRNHSITLSVLDRLLDDTPEHVAPRPHTVADLRAAIRRDLENLLNTRRRVLGWPDDLTELGSSILGYGCHDLLVENVATDSRRRAVVAQIETAIRQWEPRFAHLQVAVVDNADPADRSLRFRIEALIHADPAPEPMVFDSVVDPTSNMVTVTSKARG